MNVSTTIMVSDETWEKLNERKGRGESFDDVINRLLDTSDSGNSTTDEDDLVTDGGAVPVCPYCESAKISPRNGSDTWGRGDAVDDWKCETDGCLRSFSEPAYRQPEDGAGQELSLSAVGQAALDADPGDLVTDGSGTARHPHHDSDVSIEDACIECGEYGAHRCGCCGFALCGRHHETGGGFCTRFTPIAGIPLCVHGENVYVRALPPVGDTPASVLAERDDQSTTYHLPTPEAYDSPYCGGPSDSEIFDRPLEDALLDDHDLCPACSDRARREHQARNHAVARELAPDGGRLQCDYCDGTALVYELHSDRGPVARCIPCLAVEQGQEAIGRPPTVYDSLEDNRLEADREGARDWYRVLARIAEDRPVVAREPDSIGALRDSTRSFLTNIMGDDAHRPPSELVDGDLPAGPLLTVNGGGADE